MDIIKYNPKDYIDLNDVGYQVWIVQFTCISIKRPKYSRFSCTIIVFMTITVWNIRPNFPNCQKFWLLFFKYRLNIYFLLVTAVKLI